MLTRRARCAELEAQVAELRRENQHLRDRVAELGEGLRIAGQQYSDLSSRYVPLMTEVCELRQEQGRAGRLLLAWCSARRRAARLARRGWS